MDNCGCCICQRSRCDDPDHAWHDHRKETDLNIQRYRDEYMDDEEFIDED